ncbi:MAG: hypothetical protein IJU68_06905 [Bacteroidales bacterium]|nr:hypothetical protein [Bacteroidales bacterium]
MKIRILLAAALLVCSCSPAVKDLEKFNLNCNASEVTLQSDTLELPYTAYFNKHGQLDSIVTRNFDGGYRSTESYSYDKKGRLAEISGINADGESEIRYEYEFDGRFVRECRIYGMNNQEMHRWIHSNDGRHIVRTEYYNEGELEYITTKKFSGNSYSEETINEDGEIIGQAEVDFFRNENKPMHIRSSQMNVDIEYNGNGLPVMSREAVLNSLGEMEWTPDLETNPDRYYSYEYDKRGNWISRAEKIHPDSTAVIVLRRTIKY